VSLHSAALFSAGRSLWTLGGDRENTMGFLRKLLGVPAPIEVMRADLYMEYHPLTCTGAATVE
jgi:hypothetical protein